MHLTDILRLRVVLGAGVFLAITRRCPLTCAHCSTVSSMASEEHDATPFLTFVDSFTSEDHPELIYLTGGEALIRPALVRELTSRAKSVGTRSVLLTGMYFARESGRVPTAVKNSLGSVDHLTASYDEFHEREVPRRYFFDALHALRQLVPDVSLQVTGHGKGDAYLERLVEEIRHEFEDQVPILVSPVVPTGRARSWWPTPIAAEREQPDIPCPMAYWPVVHYDGTILPCCSQELVARYRPTHLEVGSANTLTWQQTRERLGSAGLMRAIRTFGPHQTAQKFAGHRPTTSSMCQACLTLSGDSAAVERADEYYARPASALVESAARSMINQDPINSFFSFAGVTDFRETVLLGAPA